MKLRTQERLASATVLIVIVASAAAIAWAYREDQAAGRQLTNALAIGRALNELRLATYEVSIGEDPAARRGWLALSERLDSLVEEAPGEGPVEARTLVRMRARRAAAVEAFTALAARAPSADVQPEEFRRLRATQLDNMRDALLLAELAHRRVDAAQARVLAVIVGGLLLVALAVGAASWRVRRGVLAPIVRLQQATRQLAAGSWEVALPAGGEDEIGQLSRDFGAMARSLQAAFAEARRRQEELAGLVQELEAFSYSVSHDLRAPLRAMDGFSLALAEDYAGVLDAEGRHALSRIRAASQRMGELIDDLLRLSRVSRQYLALGRVDVSALARRVAAELEAREPARRVEWRIDPGLEARADAALLEIALANLLGNAWKFTSRTPAAVIRVGADEREGGRAFFVADNGAGFDMAYAGRLFGAFQRLHRVDEYPGTGIGLALVQRIVRRHGGRIWAEAQPGKGATFWFTLGHPEEGSDDADHPAG